MGGWKSAVIALAALAASAAPAWAADVEGGTVSLAGAPVETGRLSRNGVQQDWLGDEAYPGLTATTSSFAYRAIPVAFAPNLGQDVYYDVTVTDPGAIVFASACLDAYDPANKAAGWLGDEGASGDYFPNDSRFFDVVVPAGHSLVLVFNAVTAGASAAGADWFVSAYSDTEYNEAFAAPTAAVPEPATWALALGGIGLTGAALRRRRGPARALAAA